jgi:DNA/RNA-binding protein KIN17
MGKDGGFMTAKAISNRIKAKGLGKLKFYCQMCQKQCRDDNGFKMHCETEAHMRKMLQLGTNQGRFLDHFSKQFHDGMMDIIGRRFRNTRVLANVAYNEYIKDPHHAHMTATKWVTLGTYMKYLAEQGLVTLEDTPKGLFCRYVDRDPEAVKRQRKLLRSEGAEATEEEALLRDLDKRSRVVRRLDEQVQQQQQTAQNEGIVASGPVAFSLQSGTARGKDSASRKRDIFEAGAPSDAGGKSEIGEDGSERSLKRRRRWDDAPTAAPAAGGGAVPKSSKRKTSALEEMRAAEEARKDSERRQENWVAPGIVVKYVDDQLAGGRFFNQKGEILKLVGDDEFVAVVKMIELGSVLQVDQEMLETVIPALGGPVRVVNGAYRGEDATLVRVNKESFSATLRLETGPHIGDEVDVEYEDFSKRATT